MRLSNFEIKPNYETLYFDDGRSQTQHIDNTVVIVLTRVSDIEVDTLLQQFKKPTDLLESD